MEIINLINRLQSNDIALSLSGNDLEISFDGDDLPAVVLEEIKINKAAIVDFLKKATGGKERSIPAVADQESYPVSSSQKRLWIVSQFEETSRAYNMPGVYVFEGNVDVKALEESLKELITRHEILRTVFRENEGGEVRQCIIPAAVYSFRFPYHDLRDLEQLEEYLPKEIRSAIDQPFDLTGGPLLRTCLYRQADHTYVFVYVMHHIISDGWSKNILVNELLLLYNAHIRKAVNPLTPLPIQYRDYAVWEQQQLQSASFAEHRSYWLQRFAGDLPVLELSADKPRPLIKTYHGGTINKRIDSRISRQISALCQEQGATLFMGLLAAIDVLLFRYTGQKDLLIGSPIAGRDHTDLENQIGFYVNTVALRSQLHERDSFTDLLAQVKKMTLEAYNHQVYPFDELVDELQLPTDRSRNPLFDVWLVLQNTNVGSEGGAVQLGDLKVSTYEEEKENVSRFDLSFNFTEAAGELDLMLVYNRDIYTPETTGRLADHLERLMLAIVENPFTAVNTLPYLSQAEERKLLVEFNNTGAPGPGDKTIVDLFKEQALRTPDTIALLFEETNITYKMLDEQSNRLANYLLAHNTASSNAVVAILLENSAQMVIGILAVLKAGMAYLPVDPNTPPARIAYVLHESGTRMVITVSTFEPLLTGYGGDCLLMDKEPTMPDSYVLSPDVSINTTDLAYVMFTSGSTGHPKGVMIRHECLTDYFYGIMGSTNIGDCKHFGLVSTMAADLGNTLIYPSLLTGGTLHIFSRTALLDVEQLLSHRIDCLKIVPSHWKSLQQADRPFLPDKCLIFGGEQLTPDVLGKMQQSGSTCEVYNHYGPTETTIGKVISRIDLEKITVPVPLGKPFCKSAVYIVDEWLQLVPVGVPGEICIAGVGLASGYMNQPELTALRFVANPFNETERLYRTGDLGRWLNNGMIEFLGRKDDQVKIHGYRIELAEIEHALRSHPDLTASFIQVRSADDGEKELVAYVVSGRQQTLAEIRNWLMDRLPVYMIPAQIIFLDALPLTANGKVDRKKLPDPAGFSLVAEKIVVAPRNEVEQQLAAVWKDLLNKEVISINDDFFLLGGNSLKIVRLASQIYKRFQVKLALKDFFDHAVLSGQARLIQQAQKTSFVAIRPAQSAGDYPLSSSQKRLWLLCQHESANTAYNIPGAFLFEGELNQTALEQAFQALLQRHEILRTVFKNNEQGQVRQQIVPAGEMAFMVAYHDVSGKADATELVNALLIENARQPFNLLTGPLLRAALFRLENDKWVFNIVIHHIISDGWSMQLLFTDLLTFYKAACEGLPHTLTPLRIQYKDYAAWQQDQLHSSAFNRHRNWWLQQFTGELPVLNLPADKSRPALQTWHGGAFIKKLDPRATDALKTLAAKQGGTLFMGLLALVKVLLYRYTSQNDIIVGTSIAGRDHADLEDQIGFYVNAMALRTQINGDNDFKQVLSNVSNITRQAYEHQTYPFDELVGELQLQRDMSRNPLFDVMVMLQNYDTGKINLQHQLPGLAAAPYREGENVVSKFDLTFSFAEVGEAVHCRIEYNKDIYNHDTVYRLGEHLGQMLEAVTARPNEPVATLGYLGSDEQRMILHNFNAGPTGEWPTDNLVSLFEDRVQKSPHHTALVFEKNKLSYDQLNQAANRLAFYLHQQHQVQPGDLVGIQLPRSEKVIVAILGILKSGAAYVPIDPDYPQARIEYMTADCGCKVILDELAWQQFDEIAAEYAPVNPSILHGANDLAYVIYTSGSTGKPKGVMIHHGAIINTIYSQQQIFGVQEGDRHLQFASPSFDASVSEIFVSLASGGTLYIIKEADKRNPVLLEEYITANEIDIATIPPAYLRLLRIDKISKLKKLVSAGEAAILEQAIAFSQQGTFFNAYGPTECSICTTIHTIPMGAEIITSNIPIGRPIHNTRAYILDSNLNPVPVGVYGELFFSGQGLANGYLHRPELSAEKFIADPFIKGTYMYGTGDMGRWLADGNIEFAGRKDDQVKVRGYRIELAEIEHLLRAHPDVESAIVLIRSNAREEKELVAYVVCKQPCEADQLRAYLDKELPPYMLPAHIIFLEELPLTKNGKVNKAQLPDPYAMERADDGNYAAPDNVIQQKLVAIWGEILGRERVGVRDDYFMLGGDSLKVISILQKVLDETGVVLPINLIFQERSIERIAVWLIDEMGKTSANTTGTVEKAEEEKMVYDISYNQHTFLSGSKKENQLVITPYEFEHLDMDAFGAAIDQLVERHEILRTRFIRSDAGIMQEIMPAGSFRLPIPDVIPVSTEEELTEITQLAHERKIDPFRDPLIYVQICRRDIGTYVLLLTMHHALTDGFSDGILRKEILHLYSANVQKTNTPLPPLKSQYRHFVEWQKDFIESAEGQRHSQYWLQQLQGFPAPVSTGFSGTPGNGVQGSKSICIVRLIEGALFEKLDHFGQKHGITRSAFLMAGLHLLTGQLNGDDKTFIFVTVSGRSSKYFGSLDISETVGLFANPIIIVGKIDKELQANKYFLQVQTDFLEGLSYGAFPLEKLMSELPQLAPNEYRKGQVYFNYHNYNWLRAHNYTITEQEREGRIEYPEPMEMAMGIAVKEYNNCLKLEMSFDHKRFTPRQAFDSCASYFSLLNQVIVHEDLPVRQLMQPEKTA
ncbi:hypothetical protein A4H97_22225 [Niastella yeongjuensis]|uniref:Carrier domain-containing protein n=1 Tax=Niastella yeongjuensis TaxID=354355 RepID=A0A1V9F7K5_9BACT|nr:non-ribosomal peptide synthetase [Niastella yeongjuensis]OQP54217.1 hypothetical protein A4H97_22225 [Niastella yeongjuensis]SEP31800.1 amino acid adenylation domain-containing protein [Niastella yeongjuensis]